MHECFECSCVPPGIALPGRAYLDLKWKCLRHIRGKGELQGSRGSSAPLLEQDRYNFCLHTESLRVVLQLMVDLTRAAVVKHLPRCLNHFPALGHTGLVSLAQHLHGQNAQYSPRYMNYLSENRKINEMDFFFKDKSTNLQPGSLGRKRQNGQMGSEVK